MEFAVALVAASAVPGPEVAAAAMLFLAGSACLTLMCHLCRRARHRNPLRRCPLCSAEAVGAAEYELMDGPRIRVQQRCGQCGVWRRVVTNPATVARHQQALEEDRMRILRGVERLELRRTLVDTDAFVVTLRDRVVGAEDLLALLHN